MRQLSQVLESMPPQSSEKRSDISLTQQAGSMVADGTMSRLREIASQVSKGYLMDDRELEMSLAQHFGSRFVRKQKLDHVYSAAGGYEPKVIGNDVEIDGLGDAEMKLFDAIDFLNKPASQQFVAGKLAQLRTVMARASESQNDIEIVIATYAEHIRQYPQDIVAHVIDRCIHTRKWFPLISELCAEMEALASFRRAVRTAFEEARNPLLAGKVEAKRIAADPRLQMSFRELKKKDWLSIHWRWYVEDAEHMAQLSRDQGRDTQADEWHAIFEQRQRERNEARIAA